MEKPLAMTIAVPAYNEGKKLEETVKNILRAKSIANNLSIEIIIINDGSTDNTESICHSLAAQHDFVRIINHDLNRGLGQSVKESIAAARGEKWAVLPGDNDTPLEAITTLFTNFDKADMVMLYFVNRENRGRRRNAISTLFNTIYLLVFNIYVQYLNGPGTFPTHLLRKIDIFSTRFSIIAEIRVKLLRQGHSFHELPTYMQTGAEASSAISFRNLLEVISTFIYLVLEIHFLRRKLYNSQPIRII